MQYPPLYDLISQIFVAGPIRIEITPGFAMVTLIAIWLWRWRRPD